MRLSNHKTYTRPSFWAGVGVCIFFMLAIQAAESQSNAIPDGKRLLKNGIYVSPWSAFDSKKEIHVGYSRRSSNLTTWSLGVNLQYEKTPDPNFREVDEEIFLRKEERSCTEKGELILLFPYIQTSNCDPITDSIDISSETEKYLQGNYALEWNMNFFFNGENKIDKGLYFFLGARAGWRSYQQYTFTTGSLKKGIQLIDSDWDWGGYKFTIYNHYTYALYQMEKVEKQTINEFSFIPHAGFGLRIPILKRITIEASGLAYYGKKATDISGRKKFHAEPVVVATLWF